jgi:hypothetical protein
MRLRRDHRQTLGRRALVTCEAVGVEGLTQPDEGQRGDEPARVLEPTQIGDLRHHALHTPVDGGHHNHGFCRKFSFEAICGMVSL